MYLEARALGLTILTLAGFIPQTQIEVGLSRREAEEMVRVAQALLMTPLDKPTGLEELPRAVGLNRDKLNRGFRQLYGATVFTLSHEAR